MARINLNVDQGAHFFIQISVEDQTGLPLDLTTYTVRGQMRKHYSDPDAITMTLAKGNGTIDVSMTATETAALSPGYYVYDIHIKDASNNVTRLFEGMVLVSPGVTSWANTTPETPVEDVIETGDRIR